MVVLTATGKEALDTLVAKTSQEQKVPGFLFAATSVDEELYFKTTGYNVVNNPESGKINEDSMFWICSQGKMIVHLAALQLVEQGRITFESPISDYIPEFANLVIVDDQMADVWTYKPAKKVMRLKHVLNFTSGLFYAMKGLQMDQQIGPYAASHDKENPISHFLSVIKGDLPGIPLLFEPGDDFAYGYSSDIVGFVVEKVSGQSLEKYLQENIFKPLGMKASFYLTPDIKERLVDLTYRRGEKLEAWAGQTTLIEQDPSKVTCHMGGVGLYASLKDYLNFLRHLLQIHAGKASNPIISAETLRGIFEPALSEAGSQSLDDMLSVDPNIPKKGTQWSTAFSLSTSDWPGRRKKGTGSWWGWAQTFFFIDPTTGVAAVFGMQMIPTLDQNVLKLVADLEKALYSGLEE